MILLALLMALGGTSPMDGSQVHISVQNQWVQQVYVYELNVPKSCPGWTFGGTNQFNEPLLVGRTLFANATEGDCAQNAKLFVGFPGSLSTDCWFNLNDNSLSNGDRAACKMEHNGSDYSIVYRLK